MSSRTALVTVVFSYCAVLVYLCSPFLFGGQSLFVADVTYNFVPAARFIEQVFQAEHGFTLLKPLWNPYLLCGAPQVSVAWPLSYLPGYAAFLLDPTRSTGLLIFFHLLVAGVGGYIWFSRHSFEGDPGSPASDSTNQTSSKSKSSILTLLTSAPALFGLMFMLCGYLIGSSINLSLLFSVCWIPLALNLIDRLSLSVRGSLVSLTGLLAFVLAQQFGAGRPEMFLSECALYVFYALLKIVEFGSSRANEKAVQHFIACLSLAVLLSLLFNAANILPMMEAVKNSPHLPKFDPGDALNWSAGWFEFLSIVLMKPLGELDMAHYSLYPTYPNSMAYVTSLFLGAPVLVLAFIGTADTSWRQKPFWLWMIILFTLVSLGEFVPIWKPVFEAIPSINLLRFPVKQTVFIDLALASLAARGWFLVIKGAVTKSDLIGASIFWSIFCVCGFGFYFATSAGNMQALGAVMAMSSGCDDLNLAKTAALTLTSQLGVAGVQGLLICACIFLMSKTNLHLIMRCSVVLIVASTLLFNAREHLWHTVDSSFFNKTDSIFDRLNSPKNLESNIKSAESDIRILSLFHHPIAVPEKVSSASEKLMDAEFMRYARYILAPNTNIDRGIHMLSGMPVIPDWLTVFMETGILARSSLRAELTHEAGKSDVPLYKWCQATATRYILSPMNTQSEEDLTVSESKRLNGHYFPVALEDEKENVRIYEVSPLRKRAQLLPKLTLMNSRTEVLKHINRSDTLPFDPMSEVLVCEPDEPGLVSFASRPPLLDRDLLAKISGNGSVNRPGDVQIVADDRERVELTVNASVPSVLVFADSYYSGWHATDNGSPTHILLADGLLKAILVDAGEHKVVFKYEPRSYFVGLYVSGFTLFLLLCMIFGGRALGPTLGRRQREIIQS